MGRSPAVKRTKRDKVGRRAQVRQKENAWPVVIKQRKKETKREKCRRLRDSEEFPGLSDLVTAKSKKLVAGRGILALCGMKEEIGDIEPPEATVEVCASNEAESGSAKFSPEFSNDEKTENSKPAVTLVEDEGFISIDIDSDSELGRQFAKVEESDEELEGEAPWLSNSVMAPQPDESVGSHLGREMVNFVAYMSPSAAEQQRRNACVGRLRRIVKQLWPTARVDVFGSYATGLYLPDADIDVVILDTESLRESKLRSEMYKLGHRLKSNGITTSPQVIAHARVPIVKYTEVSTGLHVDIAFGQTSGVEVVSRVSQWLTAQPALKPLAMVVRCFLKARNMSDVASGGVGGYATLCMAYSRLMQWCLHRAPKTLNDPQAVLLNIGLLLIDFFDYYGHEFDNATQVVRVNPSFKPYVRRLNGNMASSKPCGLAIEDPNDYGNNVSKGSFNYSTVKRSFGNAADYLKALCVTWEKRSPVEKRKMSFLAPLLRYDEDIVRTKVSLVTVLAPPSKLCRDTNGNANGNANGGGKLVKNRYNKHQRGSERCISHSSQPAKSQLPESQPSQLVREMADPWSGKPEEPNLEPEGLHD